MEISGYSCWCAVCSFCSYFWKVSWKEKVAFGCYMKTPVHHQRGSVRTNFLPLSPNSRQTWWFHKCSIMCWLPGVHMWAVMVMHMPPLLWSRLMCISEERTEKQEEPSVQNIHDRDGEGERLNEGIDTKRNLKCMCACVCAFPGASVPVAFLLCISVSEWNVCCICYWEMFIMFVKMYLSIWQHKAA